MRASVIGTRHLGSRMISENMTERIISESFVNMPERVIDNKPAPRRSIRKSVAHLIEEEPIIVEKIVEKEVEVIVERIVPKYIYKDVPYNVYVEQPIERIIEKEIEIEQIIEKEIEKTIEIPVERIIEIPIEEVVEKRVEVIKYIDVPRVQRVRKEIEDHIEDIVYDDRTIDCDIHDLYKYPNAHILPTHTETQHIENTVPRPVFHRNHKEHIVQEYTERIIKRPVDKITEHVIENIVQRPHFVSRPIENIVTIPIEKVTEISIEHVVEKPVYRKNIIKRPVAV